MASTLDQLILDVAHAENTTPEVIVVLDDPSGDLTSGAVESGVAEVITVPRDAIAARIVETDVPTTAKTTVSGMSVTETTDTWAYFALRASDLRGRSTLAIGRLPKSLAELDYLSSALANAGVERVVLGANVKHMTTSANEHLARDYEDVHGSRGRGKFRCVVAGSQRENVSRRGMRTTTIEVSTPAGPNKVTLHGVGGVFSSAKEDSGGRLLATAFLTDVGAPLSENLRVLDLGCGNGSVSVRVLSALPVSHVLALDVQVDAAESARRTLIPWIEEGCAVVVCADGTELEDNEGFDTILLNPPFHDRTVVDATLVDDLVVSAEKLLRTGGNLYFVHNSYLRYRHLLEDAFESVRELARDATFTVLHARKGEREGRGR